MVGISRPWYNCSYTMAAKPIKSLKLHYTMIQFLIMKIRQLLHRQANCEFAKYCVVGCWVILIDNIDISKTLSGERFPLFYSLRVIKLQNNHPLGASKRMGTGLSLKFQVAG